MPKNEGASAPNLFDQLFNNLIESIEENNPESMLAILQSYEKYDSDDYKTRLFDGETVLAYALRKKAFYCFALLRDKGCTCPPSVVKAILADSTQKQQTIEAAIAQGHFDIAALFTGYYQQTETESSTSSETSNGENQDKALMAKIASNLHELSQGDGKAQERIQSLPEPVKYALLHNDALEDAYDNLPNENIAELLIHTYPEAFTHLLEDRMHGSLVCDSLLEHWHNQVYMNSEQRENYGTDGAYRTFQGIITKNIKLMEQSPVLQCGMMALALEHEDPYGHSFLKCIEHAFTNWAWVTEPHITRIMVYAAKTGYKQAIRIAYDRYSSDERIILDCFEGGALAQTIGILLEVANYRTLTELLDKHLAYYEKMSKSHQDDNWQEMLLKEHQALVKLIVQSPNGMYYFIDEMLWCITNKKSSPIIKALLDKLIPHCDESNEYYIAWSAICLEFLALNMVNLNSRSEVLHRGSMWEFIKHILKFDITKPLMERCSRSSNVLVDLHELYQPIIERLFNRHIQAVDSFGRNIFHYVGRYHLLNMAAILAKMVHQQPEYRLCYEQIDIRGRSVQSYLDRWLFQAMPARTPYQNDPVHDIAELLYGERVENIYEKMLVESNRQDHANVLEYLAIHGASHLLAPLSKVSIDVDTLSQVLQQSSGNGMIVGHRLVVMLNKLLDAEDLDKETCRLIIKPLLNILIKANWLSDKSILTIERFNNLLKLEDYQTISLLISNSTTNEELNDVTKLDKLNINLIPCCELLLITTLPDVLKQLLQRYLRETMQSYFDSRMYEHRPRYWPDFYAELEMKMDAPTLMVRFIHAILDDRTPYNTRRDNVLKKVSAVLLRANILGQYFSFTTKYFTQLLDAGMYKLVHDFLANGVPYDELLQDKFTKIKSCTLKSIMQLLLNYEIPTPLYNHLRKRLHEKIVTQICHDMKWLVLDAGVNREQYYHTAVPYEQQQVAGPPWRSNDSKIESFFSDSAINHFNQCLFGIHEHALNEYKKKRSWRGGFIQAHGEYLPHVLIIYLNSKEFDQKASTSPWSKCLRDIITQHSDLSTMCQAFIFYLFSDCTWNENMYRDDFLPLLNKVGFDNITAPPSDTHDVQDQMRRVLTAAIRLGYEGAIAPIFYHLSKQCPYNNHITHTILMQRDQGESPLSCALQKDSMDCAARLISEAFKYTPHAQDSSVFVQCLLDQSSGISMSESDIAQLKKMVSTQVDEQHSQRNQQRYARYDVEGRYYSM